MRTCQHCKEEVSASTKFCNHCGKSLEDKQINEQEESATSESQQQEEVKKETPPVSDQKVKNEKNTSKKKTNIIIISAIAIIVLVIGIAVLGKFQSSVDHLLKDFETAVKDNDAKKLADILTVDHKELEITEESVEGLIQLYESNPSELTYLLNNLKAQAQDLGGLTNMYPIDLIKDGKKFVFYDDYKLIVNPVYIKVTTDYKDTDIIMNDEVLVTTDKDDYSSEIGPILPGKHVIEAVYDTGFFHLTTEEEVQASDPGFAQYVSLRLDGTNVSFNLSANRYSDLKSIKLFINGKDTEWNIAKEDRVGPLLTDGSMNVSFEADLPWGTIRTDDIPLDDSYFTFNLGKSEEFQQTIMDRIILFEEEYVKAYANASPEDLTTTTNDFAVLIAENTIGSILQGGEYTGAYHGTDFYTDSFILKQDYDGYWRVTVDTITYHEEAYFDEGDKATAEKVEEEVRYELVYDPQSKEWLIDDADYAGLMEEDKMERYKVEEPVVHTSDWKKIIEEVEKEGELE